MNIFKLSEKAKIIKNLIVINVSFFLTFAAFNSVASVQAILNQSENLGITTYFIMFALQIVTCLVFPSILFHLLGFKWSMLVCEIFFLLFIAFQALPEWYTLLPTCIFCGLGLSIIWNIIGAYVTILAKNYSKLTNTNFSSIQLVFFGLTGSIFLLSFTLGAILIGSIVKIFKNEISNITFYDYSKNCGINNCPQTKLPVSDEIILKESIYWLYGSLDLLMIISIILTILLMDDVKDVELNTSQETKSLRGNIKKECNHLLKISLNKKIWLLFPISIYTGFELTYIWFEFNRGFVSCLRDLKTIAWTNGLLGLLGSILSLIMGFFLKRTGPVPGILIMLSASFCQCIFDLAWLPNVNSSFLIFLMVVGLSLSQSIASGQVRGLYGIYFENNSITFGFAAFSQSIGFFLGSIISVYFCTRIKIYVFIAIILLSLITYSLLLSLNDVSVKNELKNTNDNSVRETNNQELENIEFTQVKL